MEVLEVTVRDCLAGNLLREIAGGEFMVWLMGLIALTIMGRIVPRWAMGVGIKCRTALRDRDVNLWDGLTLRPVL